MKAAVFSCGLVLGLASPLPHVGSSKFQDFREKWVGRFVGTEFEANSVFEQIKELACQYQAYGHAEAEAANLICPQFGIAICDEVVKILWHEFAICGRPVIEVGSLGSLRGVSVKGTIHSFRGIPFGKAPVGELRWQPPLPYGGLSSGPDASEPRDAARFGNACVAHYPNQNTLVEESEDCLFLNIAKPANGTNLPVMVYIHGGSYCSGDPSNASPESLVLQSGQSVVVVTINYRLNVFGFLASQSLQHRSASNSTGNTGIEDQRLALQWIQDHIGNFGGDSSDVTIFGQSAGGNSVLVHLTQPASYKLYNKAIVESGGYVAAVPFLEAEDNYNKVLQSLNCSDWHCLESVSVETIRDVLIDRFGQTIWEPVIDGIVLEDYPQKLISEGRYNNKVPVIIGSTRDEMSYSLTAPGVPKNMSEAWYMMARNPNGKFAADNATVDELVLAQVPANLGGFSKWWWAFQQKWTLFFNNNRKSQMTMGLGHCSVRCLARSFVRGGTPQVFPYLFAHGPQKQIIDINEGYPVAWTGPGNILSPHTSELPYAFGDVDMVGEEYGEADFARTIAKYWATFAKSGNPNYGDVPRWQEYDAVSDNVILLGDRVSTAISTISGYAKDICDFSDRQEGSVCHGVDLAGDIVV